MLISCLEREGSPAVALEEIRSLKMYTTNSVTELKPLPLIISLRSLYKGLGMVIGTFYLFWGVMEHSYNALVKSLYDLKRFVKVLSGKCSGKHFVLK